MSHVIAQDKESEPVGGTQEPARGKTPKSSIATIVSKSAELRANTLDAIWDSTLNKPCYTRDEKVKLLDAHWAQVFGPKEFSPEEFETLLAGYDKSIPEYRWELDKSYLEELLQRPKNSSPGPDGIPFAAYSIVYDISLSVLWDCTRDILDGNSPPDDLNNATKPSIEVDGTKWFSPKDTRLIFVVNSDSRLIANVFRKVLANSAERICCKD